MQAIEELLLDFMRNVYGFAQWPGGVFLLARGEEWFRRGGSWAVFLSRLMPVVRTFISFPAGVARMPIGRFSVLTFLGSYPWSLGLAWGGYVLGEDRGDPRAAT